MQKFAGIKPLDELIENAKEQGWEVGMEQFDKGGDFVYLYDLTNRVKQIAVNVTNGHFYVYEPISEKPTATHLSSDLDDVDWYAEILNLLYSPLVGS